MNGLVLYSCLAAAVIAGVIAFHMVLEKKKQKEIKKKFRKHNESYKTTKKNLRKFPRLTIPDSMNVTLTLTDDEYFGLKAHALDVSSSGFSVKPGFPLKKLPLNIIINNVLLETPGISIVIREMETIRIEHEVGKRLLAFRIESIDDDELEKFEQFIENVKDNSNH